MTEEHKCESCSMPIESGAYCQHCAPGGQLIAFEECVERFMQWTKKRDPDAAPSVMREQTLAFMSTMPAWKDDPRLAAARAGS